MLLKCESKGQENKYQITCRAETTRGNKDIKPCGKR